jgi:deoxyadenosine/deoxycytidine kinase
MSSVDFGVFSAVWNFTGFRLTAADRGPTIPRPSILQDPDRQGSDRLTPVRYIAIDGVIGVGKTSLVHRLHAERGGLRFLELVEENPFLTGGFYQDMERLAFDTELFFLLARFRQQRDVAEAIRSSRDLIFSDYLFEKNRIFASLTLSGRDFVIWERIYEALLPEVPSPDLVVYLRSSPARLLDRIQSRSRPFERDITEAYLERVNASYERFFATYPGRLLTIDVSQLDFVWSDADFAAVRAMVDHRMAALEAGQGELEFPGMASRTGAGSPGT